MRAHHKSFLTNSEKYVIMQMWTGLSVVYWSMKGGSAMKVLLALISVTLVATLMLCKVQATTLFEDYFSQDTGRWSLVENSGEIDVDTDPSVPGGYGPGVLYLQTPSDWSAAFVKDLVVTDCIVIALVRDVSLPETGQDADQVIIARTQNQEGIGSDNGDALEQDAPDDTGLHLFGSGGQDITVNDHHSTGEGANLIWSMKEPEHCYEGRTPILCLFHHFACSYCIRSGYSGANGRPLCKSGHKWMGIS
jgi:hypothetical protein